MTKELETYLSNVKNYVKQNTGSRVVLTGHTDDVGQEAANMKLGMQRANFAKDQLVKMGLPASRIDVTSQGENWIKPKTKNKANRDEARRCDVIIK